MEGSLDTAMYNRLVHKLTSDLQMEVRGGNDADEEFELPSYGASSLACTQGVLFLVYRTAMPSSQEDEESIEKEMKNPTKPKTPGGTVTALRALGEAAETAASTASCRCNSCRAGARRRGSGRSQRFGPSGASPSTCSC